MIITGALFAEKIDVNGNGLDIIGGDPFQYTFAGDAGSTVDIPVLLFVEPTAGEAGKNQNLTVRIVDTDGDVVGSAPAIAAPDFHTGGTVAIAEVHTQIAREWHYFLYVGEQRVKGFDVHFAKSEG
ncbi:hypothetical protein IU429_02825 [Nocardia elegans]|uniref:Uncharacterized protein n=1 Tax=Nocardia elegans TaxID=300029 RepID=A0ABW6TE48_9NOCA|nr:hypothetical protein [Nocardia elegans]MBF6446594.1 hypothetical protein [Nocardia elegans]